MKDKRIHFRVTSDWKDEFDILVEEKGETKTKVIVDAIEEKYGINSKT